MILVSKFMVHRAFSDRTYLLLGLLSPLNYFSTYSFGNTIRVPTSLDSNEARNFVEPFMHAWIQKVLSEGFQLRQSFFLLIRGGGIQILM